MMPRYLDEEKIKHTVNEYIDRTGSDVFTREHIFDFLFETETADAQEVKHGRWCLGGLDDEWNCSECGYNVFYYGMVQSKYKYCPNCGARMDGDKR